VEGAVGLLYTYQAGDTDYESFPTSTALKDCYGYWAYFPSGGTLHLPKKADVPNCTITLTDNQIAMVGNPSPTACATIPGAQDAVGYGGPFRYTYAPYSFPCTGGGGCSPGFICGGGVPPFCAVGYVSNGVTCVYAGTTSGVCTNGTVGCVNGMCTAGYVSNGLGSCIASAANTAACTVGAVGCVGGVCVTGSYVPNGLGSCIFIGGPTPSYYELSTLPPGTGAWVDGPGTVTVGPPAPSNPPPVACLAPGSSALPDDASLLRLLDRSSIDASQPTQDQSPASVPSFRLYGTVTQAGCPTPIGQTVQAASGASPGAVCGTATVDSLGDYAMEVQPLPGCTAPGGTVLLTLNGLPAQQTATIPQIMGTSVNLDLSFP
jgi:hypothetical protein